MRTPPPYPTGWFVVAESREVRPGEVHSTTAWGRELVVWRPNGGAAVVTDAHCPHLGAHFGHGGCVEAERLRCPFHDFRFDPTGRCVQTGYDTKPPPKAVLRTYPTRELSGWVVAYFDAEGKEPAWEPPPPDETGFVRLYRHTFTLRSHPQETSENSVDLGHLSVVHSYERVRPTAPMRAEGPLLRTSYAFERPRGVSKGRDSSVTAEADIFVHGLGWSVVEVNVAALGLRTRQYVLATPVDGETIRLRLGMAFQRIDKPGRLHPALSIVPPGLATSLVGRLGFRNFLDDVRQDFRIWENKRYLERPALADGDGPIGPYRKWARQFYPQGPEGAVLPVLAAG